MHISSAPTLPVTTQPQPVPHRSSGYTRNCGDRLRQDVCTIAGILAVCSGVGAFGGVAVYAFNDPIGVLVGLPFGVPLAGATLLCAYRCNCSCIPLRDREIATTGTELVPLAAGQQQSQELSSAALPPYSRTDPGCTAPPPYSGTDPGCTAPPPYSGTDPGCTAPPPYSGTDPGCTAPPPYPGTGPNFTAPVQPRETVRE